MWGYLFLFVKMGVVKVNKIYRTVYNEITHTWVAANETAKHNRKSSGTVVNCTNAGVSSLKSKSYSLTAVVAALALAIPFMANEAHAYMLCKDGSDQVFAKSSCGSGEKILWVSGDNDGSGISSIAIGKNASATAGDLTSEVNGAIAIGEYAWALTPHAITIGSAGRGEQGLGGRTLAKDSSDKGGYSIAIGYRAANFLTNGNDDTAYYANTKYATAIGAFAHTHARNTLAMGFSTDATGERSFALGTGSTELNEQHKGARAGGQGSIVIGDRAIAYSKTGDVQTDTNVNDSVAIGTGSHVKSRNSVAMGGSISYTYYTGGDAKTSYYDNGWKKDAESTGAKVGTDADGAIALGGASADVTDGGNDYYPSTIATVDVDSYVKAAQVADGAKRAIAMGSGSQVGGEIDLSSTTIYESSYKSEVNGDPAKDITGKQGVAADKKGADSVALGPKNAVLEDASTAVGQENLVLTKNSGALGYKSVVAAKTSYSLGNGNILGNNSAGEIENVFAFGNNITKTASRSVFLGDNAAYVTKGTTTSGLSDFSSGSSDEAGKYETNKTAIKDENGNVIIAAGTLDFAGADPVGVVSVGNKDQERRIQNVAAGLIDEKSTDAINGSQLYAVIQKFKPGGTTIINNDVSINAGNNIQVTKNGPNNYTIATTRDINVEGDLNVEGNTTVNNFAINPNSNVDIGGNQIHNVAAGTADTDAVNVGQLRQAIDDVNNHINAVSKQADAAAAAAIAVASMPQSYLPGKNLIAIGGGTYNGQTGYAIGLSTISDNGAWIFKATATGNSKKRFGAGVGAGFLW